MATVARCWLAVLLVTTLACSAYAQRATSGEVPRYAPQSPTTSPYLNLLNRNGSAASNYFGLVRPLQRQQHINERATQQTYNQQQELQLLKKQQVAFDQPDIKPTGTAGWFQDYGPSMPYQKSDHYYGQWQTRGGPQRRTTARR